MLARIGTLWRYLTWLWAIFLSPLLWPDFRDAAAAWARGWPLVRDFLTWDYAGLAVAAAVLLPVLLSNFLPQLRARIVRRRTPELPPSPLALRCETHEPFVSVFETGDTSRVRLFRVALTNTGDRTLRHVRVRVCVRSHHPERTVTGLLPVHGPVHKDEALFHLFSGHPVTVIDINPGEAEYFAVAAFHEGGPADEDIILACVPHHGFSGDYHGEFLPPAAAHNVALRATADAVAPAEMRFRLWVDEWRRLNFAPFAP